MIEERYHFDAVVPAAAVFLGLLHGGVGLLAVRPGANPLWLLGVVATLALPAAAVGALAGRTSHVRWPAWFRGAVGGALCGLVSGLLGGILLGATAFTAPIIAASLTTPPSLVTFTAHAAAAVFEGAASGLVLSLVVSCVSGTLAALATGGTEFAFGPRRSPNRTLIWDGFCAAGFVTLPVVAGGLSELSGNMLGSGAFAGAVGMPLILSLMFLAGVPMAGLAIGQHQLWKTAARDLKAPSGRHRTPAIMRVVTAVCTPLATGAILVLMLANEPQYIVAFGAIMATCCVYSALLSVLQTKTEWQPPAARTLRGAQGEALMGAVLHAVLWGFPMVVGLATAMLVVAYLDGAKAGDMSTPLFADQLDASRLWVFQATMGLLLGFFVAHGALLGAATWLRQRTSTPDVA